MKHNEKGQCHSCTNWHILGLYSHMGPDICPDRTIWDGEILGGGHSGAIMPYCCFMNFFEVNMNVGDKFDACVEKCQH